MEKVWCRVHETSELLWIIVINHENQENQHLCTLLLGLGIQGLSQVKANLGSDPPCLANFFEELNNDKVAVKKKMRLTTT